MTIGRPFSTSAERHICVLLAIISLTQAYHLSANDDAAEISASGSLLLQTKATQKSGMAMPGSSFFEEDAVQAAPQLQKLPDIPMMAPHDVGGYAVPVVAPEETSLMAFADQSLGNSGSTVNMEDPDSEPIAVEPPLPSSSDLLPSHRPSALGQLQTRTGQSADVSRWRLKAAAEVASRKPEVDEKEDEESNEENSEKEEAEEEKAEKEQNQQNEEDTDKGQAEDEESPRTRKRTSEHEAQAEEEINEAKEEEEKDFKEEVNDEEHSSHRSAQKAKTKERSSNQNDEYEEASTQSADFEEPAYAHAAASTNKAADLAPEHGGHCIPTCTWKCDSPKCDEDCEPVCQAPKCETRCAGISTAGCSMECTKPHCAVMCAKTMCSGGGCPECATKCSEPQCNLKCPKSKACKNVCEQPRCEWKCKAPLHCPKPKCQMFCETPKKCHSASFSQRLPPLQAGQMGVPSFAAPREQAESGVVDVDVLSHALPRRRQVSLPVLPFAAAPWVPARAGESIPDGRRQWQLAGMAHS